MEKKAKKNLNPDAIVHPGDEPIADLFRRAVALKGITPPARGEWASIAGRQGNEPTAEVAAIARAMGCGWEVVAYLLGLRSHSPIAQLGPISRANLASAYRYVLDVGTVTGIAAGIARRITGRAKRSKRSKR